MQDAQKEIERERERERKCGVFELRHSKYMLVMLSVKPVSLLKSEVNSE